MKEFTVSDIQRILDNYLIWVRADSEEEVFAQSNINSEIPNNILTLPVSLCTTQYYHGKPVVICKISKQTLLENGAHIVDDKVVFPFKVYVCRADSCDYDQYDEITLIAQSENRATQMIKGFFTPFQEPIKIFPICECFATDEQILTCSFNAG